MPQTASPLPGAGESVLHHLTGPSACISQHQPRSRGLVLLGYSPKPYRSREPFGQLHSSLINNAHVVVTDVPELDRAALQVPSMVKHRTVSMHCGFELVVGDEEIADMPFARRCLYMLQPSN